MNKRKLIRISYARKLKHECDYSICKTSQRKVVERLSEREKEREGTQTEMDMTWCVWTYEIGCAHHDYIYDECITRSFRILSAQFHILIYVAAVARIQIVG